MASTPTAETILIAVALVVAVLAPALVGVRGDSRLRLAAAAGDESRQARHVRSADIAALNRRLRKGLRRLLLRLMLRAGVLLLVARRKRLRVARNKGLRLLRWRLRRVARLVLAQERLAVVVAVIIVVVSRALRRGLALLPLRIVIIGVLLAELFLGDGDQPEIMFGVLVVVFGSNRIAGALRVARKLDVFLRDMRGGAANFHVGAVRLVDPRQRILAFAVGVVAAAAAASPHTFLTVSHDVPVRRPFALLALPRR